MAFPSAARVVYERTPLAEVICQVRFPTMLRIDTEVPAAFQALVAREFPVFSETAEIRLLKPMGEDISGIPPELFKEAMKSSPQKNYSFKTVDQHWAVNLTRDFVALSTKKYSDWEDFKRRLVTPLQALASVYEPTSWVQVGLRYRDVFIRSRLGVTDVPWESLIRPTVLGMLAEGELVEPSAVESKAELLVPSTGGLTMLLGSRVGVHNQLREQVFELDSDFIFKGMSEPRPEQVFDVLGRSHTEAWQFFRWAITDQLHQAMGPRG